MMMIEKLVINQKVIKLWQLADRLKVSEQWIVSILLSAGYNLPKNNPNISLTSNQVKVIAEVYVNSVKDLHKKSSSNFKDLSSKHFQNLKRFFSHFISNPRELEEAELFSVNLDEELIRDFFYRVVYAQPHSAGNIYFSHIHGKLKFKIHNSVKINRTRIFSINFTNSNRIYPNEDEDHNRYANLQLCLSAVINIYREALNSTTLLLKPLTWNTLNY